MIGIFDSGVGGLTVAREVMRLLPDYPILYLGDTARTPYGNKSPEVVAAYGLEAARFLIEQGAKIIIVACNTVSAIGLEQIKQTYLDMPVFDVITPAVEALTREIKVGHIGVIGTRALVGSGIYQRLLAATGSYKVTAGAAPLLVPFIEEGWFDKPETKRIIKSYIRPLKQAGIDTLVLACTHYPLLKGLIAARVGKKIRLVDPAVETAKALKVWLYEHSALAAKMKKGDNRFCVTDLTTHTEMIARKWLKQDINLEKVTLN